MTNDSPEEESRGRRVIRPSRADDNVTILTSSMDVYRSRSRASSSNDAGASFTSSADLSTSSLELSIQTRIFKIIVIGDSNVGKTCLTFRFTGGSFPDKTEATIGVDFREKAVEIEGETIKECNGHRVSASVPRVLVGNKCDLVDQVQVPSNMALKFADSHNMLLFETSAKDPRESQNVDSIFMSLACRLKAQKSLLYRDVEREDGRVRLTQETETKTNCLC
ncbi:ras-related protein Rab-33A isoform X2 [Phyllopteryx taeniolatus]|uniref:ras-related protein Rab-33A isoform X2 n=1 Tax=Phyllopteryx taeniolatus TaxID=161469 RepID=UPI002AD3B36A|nr:ras-related protein Rab-33A isoform X2 [Phyllopteryx taeniolatus]